MSSLEEVVNAARVSKGPVVFAVWWKGGGGHAMVAFRDIFGRVRFADQGGKLLAMSDISGSMQSVYGEMLLLHEALVVQTMKAGTMLQLLAAQLNLLDPNGMMKLEQGVRAKRGLPQRWDRNPAYSAEQLCLFDAHEPLHRAVDGIRERFGFEALRIEQASRQRGE